MRPVQVLDDAPPRTASPPRWTRGWRFVVVVVLVAALTHLPGLIRNEVLNPDEAFLATQAQVINDGGHLYHDVVDRKPPLVPYLYAAVQRVTGSDDLEWVRLLGLVAHVVTALLLAGIARRRWGDVAAFGAAMLYLVASGGLVLEDSQPANFEVFMLPLMTGAMYFADREQTSASGFMAAVATLAKQVAATTMLPLAYLAWRRDSLRGVVRLGIAFVVPIAIAAALFGWSDFMFWVFTGTGSYLDASGSGAVVLHRGLSGFGLFFAANLGALLLVMGAWRRWRDDLDIWLWLVAALIGVSAGFRYFGHYFLQLAPPFSLLAAGTLATAHRVVRSMVAALAVASIAVFVAIGFVFQPKILHSYDRIVTEVEARTAPTDRIFVWGQFPQVYWASDRRPATRFLTASFLTGFSGGRSKLRVGPQYAVPGAWDDFEADLAAHPPALIVDASEGTVFSAGGFREFATYLNENYTPVESVDGVVLYERR